MSKVITSPVKHFKGSVTLQDPLYFPQVIAMRDAFDAVEALGESPKRFDYNHAILAGIVACIEECTLSGGVPVHPSIDNFPFTPYQSANKLIDWLIAEIDKIYRETEEIPNA